MENVNFSCWIRDGRQPKDKKNQPTTIETNPHFYLWLSSSDDSVLDFFVFLIDWYISHDHKNRQPGEKDNKKMSPKKSIWINNVRGGLITFLLLCGFVIIYEQLIKVQSRVFARYNTYEYLILSKFTAVLYSRKMPLRKIEIENERKEWIEEIDVKRNQWTGP